MSDLLDQEGGFIICRPKRIELPSGGTCGIRYMSDLHIGAAHNDYDLIKSELEDARKNNDRILINGDVFDLILPKDHKRFVPDVLHSTLRGRRDVVNASVDLAVKILGPYADLIDMIGVGNHETAVEKHHSTDITRMLIEELHHILSKKKTNHQIHYGGYVGYVDYRFKLTSGTAEDRTGGRYIIFYYHGGGGAAPITKGMIDFSRLQMWVGDASVIWIGHKHNKITSQIRVIKCPKSGDQPILQDVHQIMTGAYYDTYYGQSQTSIKNRGRLSNYAADGAMAPQGKGGIRAELTINCSSIKCKLIHGT